VEEWVSAWSSQHRHPSSEAAPSMETASLPSGTGTVAFYARGATIFFICASAFFEEAFPSSSDPWSLRKLHHSTDRV
jgi:hypothetical protein